MYTMDFGIENTTYSVVAPTDIDLFNILVYLVGTY